MYTQVNQSCSDTLTCCDCGGVSCGCSYCWSCNCCKSCKDGEYWCDDSKSWVTPRCENTTDNG